MAKAAFYQKADVIEYTNTGEAIGYHDVVVMGSLVGVAEEEIASNETGAVAIVGAFSLPTDAADITVGMPVYWDASSGKAVKENSGSLPCAGVAVGASASGSVPVKLNVLSAVAG